MSYLKIVKPTTSSSFPWLAVFKGSTESTLYPWISLLLLCWKITEGPVAVAALIEKLMVVVTTRCLSGNVPHLETLLILDLSFSSCDPVKMDFILSSLWFPKTLSLMTCKNFHFASWARGVMWWVICCYYYLNFWRTTFNIEIERLRYLLEQNVKVIRKNSAVF